MELIVTYFNLIELLSAFRIYFYGSNGLTPFIMEYTIPMGCLFIDVIMMKLVLKRWVCFLYLFFK